MDERDTTTGAPPHCSLKNPKRSYSLQPCQVTLAVCGGQRRLRPQGLCLTLQPHGSGTPRHRSAPSSRSAPAQGPSVPAAPRGPSAPARLEALGGTSRPQPPPPAPPAQQGCLQTGAWGVPIGVSPGQGAGEQADTAPGTPRGLGSAVARHLLTTATRTSGHSRGLLFSFVLFIYFLRKTKPNRSFDLIC